jgi:hypothetical protein
MRFVAWGENMTPAIMDMTIGLLELGRAIGVDDVRASDRWNFSLQR